MKGFRIFLCVVCSCITVIAVVSAIVIFKNEIACFFADLKGMFDEKRIRNNGEYADYADM